MSSIKVFTKACLEALLEGFARVFYRESSPPEVEPSEFSGDQEDFEKFFPPVDERKKTEPQVDRGHRRMMAGRH